MKVLINLFLFVAATQIAWSLQAAESGAGSISGRVLDSTGNTVPNADILVVGSSATSTSKARGTANETGWYKIDGLKLGEYVIYSYKISDGYQLGSNTFVADDPARFRLDLSRPDQTMDVRTLPKGAEVKGVIRNSLTMKAVPSINVWLCRTSDPTRSGQVVTDQDGDFEHTVPAGVPITIFVDVPGFEPTLIRSLVFTPLESKEVKINLVPSLGSARSDIKGSCHYPWQR